MIGGLHSDESWCRVACQNVGIIIVDVDYRLAPEYAGLTRKIETGNEC